MTLLGVALLWIGLVVAYFSIGAVVLFLTVRIGMVIDGVTERDLEMVFWLWPCWLAVNFVCGIMHVALSLPKWIVRKARAASGGTR